MNVSLNWLKHYVDVNISPEQLAEKLTLSGMAVEGITYLGKGIEGVVTGKVEEIVKHQEADKLWICTINVGEPDCITIVTGAQNVTKGAMVPVAVVGAKLPNGMTMKKAKLRGVESFGMLCSSTELNMDAKTLLPEQREGIFILPEDTPVGRDVKEVLGLDDVILEFELTANRPDCFGILGIASEVAAATGAQLKNMPTLPVGSTCTVDSENLHIIIEDTSLCTRFSGRLLEGVKIAPSPSWMQKILRAMGMRPINNIVDVTNFVMLEMCRPMHAYDADTLEGNTLIARSAKDSEELVTLDGQSRKLTADMLAIADNSGPIGLAGVMGGLATEVTEKTRNIVLESACFYGPSIRRTSRNLGLRSEASSRFERGTDINATLLSLYRATELLQGMTTVDKVYSPVDCYPNPVSKTSIKITSESVNAHLGTELKTEEMANILRALGFSVNLEGSTMDILPPDFRYDVTGMVDIAEEIARSVGFDNIKSTLPTGETMVSEQTPVTSMNDELRDFLVACGLDEVITYSFIHPSDFDKLNIPAEHSLRNVIEISNPITDDFTVLRTTLISSLLATASYNLSRRNENITIFEVGNTYVSEQQPLVDFPKEIPMLAGVLIGKRDNLHWSGNKDDLDFYDVKGLLIDLLSKFGVSEFQLKPSECTVLHPGKSADIILEGTLIGSFGQVHPLVEKNYDFTKPVFVFELQVSPLLKTSNKIAKYTHLPKYPFMTRDLAILIPDTTSISVLQEVVERVGGAYLTEFKLFDVYTGKQVQEGFKSVAFTLTFQANDRTLTDKEVESFTQKILDELQSVFNLQLRS